MITVPTKKTIIEIDKKGKRTEKRVEDGTQYIPPSDTAMIFYLKNRSPIKWRDKQELEHSGKIDQAVEISYHEIKRGSPPASGEEGPAEPGDGGAADQ